MGREMSVIGAEDGDVVLMCAFRYALGRRSYITGVLVDVICKEWGSISSNLKRTIKREISEAINDKKAGDGIDIYHWERILALKPEVF